MDKYCQTCQQCSETTKNFAKSPWTCNRKQSENTRKNYCSFHGQSAIESEVQNAPGKEESPKSDNIQSDGECECVSEYYRPKVSRNCVSPRHCGCGRLHLSPTQHLVKIQTYHVVDSSLCNCHQCLHANIPTCCRHTKRHNCHQHLAFDDVLSQRPRRRADEHKRGKLHRKLSNDSGRLTLSESGDSSVSSVDRAKSEGKKKSVANQSTATVSPLTSTASLSVMPRRERRHTTSHIGNINEANLLTASNKSEIRIMPKDVSPHILEANNSSHFNYEKVGTTSLDINTAVSLAGTIPNMEDENINVYGICGTATGEIIATDADKVKIKIFGINGELRNSYGTPTWPRYGRGVTRTGNSGEFAVCHLTEVCVYSEDGKPTRRFKHEEFNCCWGIAVDAQGNFAVTDSRSSCIFILNPHGRIIRKIGGKINDEIKKKDKRKKNTNFRKKKTPTNISEASDQTEVFPIQPLMEGMSQVGKMITPQLTKQSQRVRIISPRYVVINSQGQILVTDTSQRCLLVFNADGSFAFMIGGGYKGCSLCGNRGSVVIGNSLPEIFPTSDRQSISIQSDTTPLKRTSWVASKRYNRSQSANATDTLSESTGEISWDENNKIDDSIRRGSLPASKGTFLTLLRNLKTKRRIKSANARGKCPEGEYSVGERLRNHFEDGLNGSSIADSPRTTRSSFKSTNISSSQSMNTLWRRQGRRRNKTADIPRAKSSDVIAENASLHDPLEEEERMDQLQDDLQQSSREEVFVDSFKRSSTGESTRKQMKLKSHKSISEPDNLHEELDKLNLSSSSNSTISEKPLRISSYSDRDLDDYSIITILKEGSDGDLCGNKSDDTGQWSERAACRKCHVTDPRGVAVDANDNILLADASKHRITLFNSHGHFIRHLITEDDGLQEPKAISLLRNNKLAVTDASKKIIIYNLINSSAVK